MDRWEDDGERTYPPSQHRLDEARRSGLVARSGDLTGVLTALAGILLLGLLGPSLLGVLTRMTARLLDGRQGSADGADLSLRPVVSAVGPVAWTLGPLLLGVLVVAVLANVAQVGFLATAEPIRPDLRRLWSGRRRIVCLRSLVRVGLALVKIAAVAVVAYRTLAEAMPRLVASAGLGAADLAAEAGRLTYLLALRVAGVLLAIALVDWVYQRWQHREDLKMTRREWLDDLRRSEGDPRNKARRRRAGTDLVGRIRQEQQR